MRASPMQEESTTTFWVGTTISRWTGRRHSSHRARPRLSQHRAKHPLVPRGGGAEAGERRVHAVHRLRFRAADGGSYPPGRPRGHESRLFRHRSRDRRLRAGHHQGRPGCTYVICNVATPERLLEDPAVSQLIDGPAGPQSDSMASHGSCRTRRSPLHEGFVRLGPPGGSPVPLRFPHRPFPGNSQDAGRRARCTRSSASPSSCVAG